jgi:hypothetical protein
MKLAGWVSGESTNGRVLQATSPSPKIDRLSVSYSPSPRIPKSCSSCTCVGAGEFDPSSREGGAAMANRASTCTTQLYDRRRDPANGIGTT